MTLFGAFFHEIGKKSEVKMKLQDLQSTYKKAILVPKNVKTVKISDFDIKKQINLLQHF